MARIPLTALTLWTTPVRRSASVAVDDVQGDALGDGDAGLLDAAVGGEENRSGGGDAGLAAVAEQAGEPVVGEPGGGGLHEQEVLGGGVAAAAVLQPWLPGDGGDPVLGNAGAGERRDGRVEQLSGAASTSSSVGWG